jgi:hypothetical protein
MPGQAGHDRVGWGELAELLRKRHLLAGLEGLVGEHHHEVLEPQRPKLLDRSVVEWRREIDTRDRAAEPRREARDLERSWRTHDADGTGSRRE